MPPFMNAWAGTSPPRAHKTAARIVDGILRLCTGLRARQSFEWDFTTAKTEKTPSLKNSLPKKVAASFFEK
jgi:hypothetical protein